MFIIVSKFIYSENNLIGLVLLLIIFLDMYSNTKKTKFSDQLFYTMILSTAFIMMTDIFRIALNGWSGYSLREVNIIVTASHFLLSSIPFMAWSIYVDLNIHRNVSKTKKRIPIFAIPSAISILFSLYSLSNQGIFFIDANNIYHRGTLHLANVFVYLIYFAGTYTQMMLNKKYIQKQNYYTLLLFGIIPLILGMLQLVDTSKSFVWLGLSVSALIIYLTIQNSKINEDYLTGLYNRRQLDQHLESSIRELSNEDLLFMIIADIDSFKKINDTYGHIEGDKALKYTAELLTASFRADDFIARYAGDEFVVITKLDNKKAAEKFVYRLRRNIDAFNERNILPYNLHISLGYDIYNPDSAMDVEQFLIHTDQLMYENKKRNKATFTRQLN